jgi:hypothetical protein
MKKSTVLFVLAIICLFIIPIVVLNKHKEPPVNTRLFSRAVPGEFMNLFTANAKKQFTVIGTKKTRSGLPVSSIIYTVNNAEGVHGYIMELFKVGLKNNEALGELIHVNKGGFKLGSDAGFVKLREGGFDLKYKDGKNDSISKVTWNFNGSQLKLNTKTDSLLYYDVQFKNFDLSYDNGSEFKANNTGLFFIHPTGKFIFLKKNKTLYTIFMSDADVKSSKPDTVLSLLNIKLPK